MNSLKGEQRDCIDFEMVGSKANMTMACLQQVTYIEREPFTHEKQMIKRTNTHTHSYTSIHMYGRTDTYSVNEFTFREFYGAKFVISSVNALTRSLSSTGCSQLLYVSIHMNQTLPATFAKWHSNFLAAILCDMLSLEIVWTETSKGEKSQMNTTHARFDAATVNPPEWTQAHLSTSTIHLQWRLLYEMNNHEFPWSKLKATHLQSVASRKTTNKQKLFTIVII